jgi:hypothetical protein
MEFGLYLRSLSLVNHRVLNVNVSVICLKGHLRLSIVIGVTCSDCQMLDIARKNDIVPYFVQPNICNTLIEHV